MALNKYLDIAPEVQKALDEGRPVVALESTIISHGMPYPQNVETALNVEKIIREHGATPATIAVIGGRLKAGLLPGYNRAKAAVHRKGKHIFLLLGAAVGCKLAQAALCNQLFGVAGELRLPAFAVEGLTEVGVLGHVGGASSCEMLGIRESIRSFSRASWAASIWSIRA